MSDNNKTAAYKMYIDGEFTLGSISGCIEVKNPANEEIIATVPEGTAEDAERALEAASRWAAKPVIKRGAMVKKLAAEVLALADVVVKEQGTYAREFFTQVKTAYVGL